MDGAARERMLAGNDRTARRNREEFRDRHVIAVNVMGAPGAGKTAVLEATARAMRDTVKIGVLAGDLATDNDAERLRSAGVRAEPITTGAACHLDADMVRRGLAGLPWRDLNFLFLENVGNLVCPALYDLGQEFNVVVLSVTEGEDKPLKYPTIFQKSDLVLLTKTDLLPQLDLDVDLLRENLKIVMPHPAILAVSSKTGEGIDAWVHWLQGHDLHRSPACAATVTTW